MSRPLRIEYPGAFYHIISRGNEKGTIFSDDNDCVRFLEMLDENSVKFHTRIHSYCLMKNHYHLIMETLKGNLCRAMHYLNSVYTSYYNEKHGRVGHLLQGRYKSILVQAEEYLNHLSRYIHLNPVRAKVVEHPVDYPWSSYKYFISGNDEQGFIIKDFILRMFDDGMEDSVREYREFVEGNMDKEKVIIKDNIIGGVILGTESFIERIKKKYIAGKEDREIPQIKQIMSSISIEEIKKIVEQRVNDKKMSRKIGIYLSHKYTDKKLMEISDCYKRITTGGITLLCKRLEFKKRKNEVLNKLIMDLENKINVKA